MGKIPRALDRARTRIEGDESGEWHFDFAGDGVAYPNLCQLLGQASVGGEERKSGRLSIWIEDHRLKVCVGLPTEKKIGFCTLDGLSGVFEDLEQALEEDRVDWRKDRRSGR